MKYKPLLDDIGKELSGMYSWVRMLISMILVSITICYIMLLFWTCVFSRMYLS